MQHAKNVARNETTRGQNKLEHIGKISWVTKYIPIGCKILLILKETLLKIFKYFTGTTD